MLVPPFLCFSSCPFFKSGFFYFIFFFFFTSQQGQDMGFTTLQAAAMLL